MSCEAKCESCGGGSDVAEHIELAGVKLCFSCRVQASAYGAENIGHMVEQQRRRASPQPEAGPVVRDKGIPDEWLEHVGKRVLRVDFPDPRFVPGIFVKSCNGGTGALIRHAGGEYVSPWSALKLLDASAPSPAKPPGGEVEKRASCPRCGGRWSNMACWCTQCYITAGELKKQGEAPHVEAQPAATLAAFDASVQEHLVPLLPGRLKCVTDVIASYKREPLRRPRPHCWVYDGAKVLHEFGGWPFEAEHAASVASDIARLLMADLARKSREGR